MRGNGQKKIEQVWRKKQPLPPPWAELPPDTRAISSIPITQKPSLNMRGKGKKGPKKVKQVWQKKQPPPPPWVELPRDITANILQRLGAVEILETAEKVCTTWRSVCKDPAFWRVIDMSNLMYLDYMPYTLDIICRHAVDRSQGQLIDIRIEHFGTDELLEYIAERCSQLRHLLLIRCYASSSKALSRFPLLEELHLFFTPISSECLEMVGLSCPLLKSFSLNGGEVRFSYHDSDDDFDEQYDVAALTIAKSMPELRHLHLVGNSLTNKGLEAILDGCPHLESLDLRQCHGVGLSGDLGKRCSQQIKNLRCPNDSAAADNEFYARIHYNEYCPFSEFDYEDYFDYDDYDDYTRWDHEDYWKDEDSDFEDMCGFC